MASHPFFTNWTTGTVTEKLDARVDFPKYHNSARCIKNGVPLPQGGVSTRAGSAYMGEVKNSGEEDSTRCRLVKFEFSVEAAYV